jgi:hypothetical protein
MSSAIEYDVNMQHSVSDIDLWVMNGISVDTSFQSMMDNSLGGGHIMSTTSLHREGLFAMLAVVCTVLPTMLLSGLNITNRDMTLESLTMFHVRGVDIQDSVVAELLEAYGNGDGSFTSELIRICTKEHGDVCVADNIVDNRLWVHDNLIYIPDQTLCSVLSCMDYDTGAWEETAAPLVASLIDFT